MSRIQFCVAVGLLFFTFPAFCSPALDGSQFAQGSLAVVDKNGKATGLCPLKHTDVRAEISGFLARVTVTQEFWNPSDEKIEAVYVFPLPQDAAVDDMTLQVGELKVRGVIKRREEAQAVFEAARRLGHVAALLDQERPNIFTQSVANITPGARVLVTISYVDVLKYDVGAYEFVFPMVVGQRYIPGRPESRKQGAQKGTDRVPDAARITPARVGNGQRAGHDISLTVELDAGVAVQAFRSVSHEINLERPSASSAVVRLLNQAEIPNRDFVLRYQVAGRQVQEAVLAHNGRKGGFLAVILQPPERFPESDVRPKEIVFVLDTSGSMAGFPIETAKRVIQQALAGLYARDTFNLITFAGDTHVLFPAPVPATAANIALAKKFLSGRSGDGGTEMMDAIRAALEPTDSQEHLRIVCFLTDGEVGNDMEILAEVQKHPNARVFSFGIGSSVNRFLLEKMAQTGRGEAEFVTVEQQAKAAAQRFYERLRSPLLTDITADWGGLPVSDVFPARPADLFAGRPVVLLARYSGSASGTVRLQGKRAGDPYTREIPVSLPAEQKRNAVLGRLWARQRIGQLMSQDWKGVQQGAPDGDLKEQIVQLGLEHRLMTQFTSFVAVEEVPVTDGGPARVIEVPLEVPAGVSASGERFLINGVSNSFGGLAAFNPGAVGATEVIEVSEAAPAVDTTSSQLMYTYDASNLPQVYSRSGGSVSSGPTKLSKKELARWRLETKLHRHLLASYDCWKQMRTVPRLPATCATIELGKVEVLIWVKSKSAETRAKLTALGFELVTDPVSANVLIGRISVEKLADLTEMEAVTLVTPAATK